MKRNLFLLLFSLPIMLQAQEMAECSKPGTFSKVQVYDGVVATFEKSDNFKICPGENTKLADLQIIIEENTLKIRKISGKKYEKMPRVRIVYKELELIEGFGQASMDTKNLIKQESIKVFLHSGATFYASFDVKFLEAEIQEGALLKADGYANYQTINVATKATFSGFDLEGNQGEVKAVTGGTAKINIVEKLDAQANTKGTINYKGTPKMESKYSMGGAIVPYKED